MLVHLNKSNVFGKFYKGPQTNKSGVPSIYTSNNFIHVIACVPAPCFLRSPGCLTASPAGLPEASSAPSAAENIFYSFTRADYL